MRKIVFDQKARVAEWVAGRVGRLGPWGNCQAFGIEDETGELIAGVVFNEYVPNVRCSMHCAGEGKRWLTRDFLYHCFNYVFNIMKCRVVINPVASTNEASLRFTAHVGFTEHTRIPGAAKDGDLVIFTLYKPQCRWLGGHHNAATTQ